MTTQDNHADEIDLTKLFNSVYEKKLFIIIITLVFFVLGLIYALSSQNLYKSDALIQIDDNTQSFPFSEGLPSLYDSGSNISAEVEIIKSRTILASVVNGLSLDVGIGFSSAPIIGRYIKNNIYFNEDSFFSRLISDYLHRGDEISITSYNNVDVQQTMSFSGKFIDPMSFIITLNNERTIQGKVNEVFTIDGNQFSISSMTARTGQEFIISLVPEVQIIDNLRKRLSISERGKSSGIVNLTLNGNSFNDLANQLLYILDSYIAKNLEKLSEEYDKSLEFVNTQLPVSKEKLSTAEGKLNSFQDISESVDLSIETQALLAQLVDIDSTISNIQLQDTQLANRYTSSHPQRRVLRDQITTLSQQKAELAAKTKTLPKTQQMYLSLARDVEVSTLIYKELLSRSQEIAIAKAATISNIRIIDSPLTFSLPISPNKGLITLISAFLGLMVATMIVIVSSALKRGIKDPDVLESELGLSLLATIPQTSNEKATTRKFRKPLLGITHPEDLAIEALRGLRTNLHFSMIDSKNSIISILGPSPGIGKSFVASNLAYIMAQSGKKVLLIDADMRRGHIHRRFKLKRDNGLSDILAGNSSYNDVVHNNIEANIDFISTGKIPPNPAELLARPQMKELLADMDKDYDVIIMDTPPVLAVTDAAIVAELAGTSILVTRYGQSSTGEIATCLNRLEKSGITVNGGVMNAVEKSKVGESYHYNYEYK